MKTPPFDQEVRDRVVEQTRVPTLVEAGAGTGKTRLLVERVLAGLKRDHYRLDRLAAITFTRLAAGEMESRLREEIQKALAGMPEGEERRRLMQARGMLPAAQISTIHSFCRRLLREYPLEAGLPPDFEDVEENRQREDLRSLWEEWLEARLDDPPAGDPLVEILAWGASLKELEAIACELAENPDAGPPPPLEEQGDEALWRRVEERWGELKTRAENGYLGKEQDQLIDQVRQQTAFLNRLGTLPPETRTRWLLARLKKEGIRFPALKGTVGKKGNYRPGFSLDDFRRDLKIWREAELPRELHRRFAPLAVKVVAALAEFRDKARARRRDRGRINATDLLYEAAVLLESRPEVVRSLRRRFQALFVDEYQDTDPLQARILQVLTREEGGPVLFLVGDPKQSIYRFRRAEVGTFLEEVKRFRERGEAAPIQVNFRSSPQLLSGVNTVLGEIFAAQRWPSGTQAAWQPLIPAPEAVTPPGPSIVLVPLEGEKQTPAEEWRRRAARAIARALGQAAALGIPWREMAVLASALTHADLLEEALEEEKIPYRMEKSRGYFQRPEVAEVAQVLQAVADPWDEVYGLAALRSRLFGFSDAELARHRAAGGALCSASTSEKGEPQIREALATLKEWQKAAERTPAPELLERILGETRFFHLLARFPEGRRAALNLSKLLDQARAQWAAGALGLAELAAWLETQIRGQDDREAESPAAQEEDRVGVMSIHAAKGLERAVVALYDIQNPGNREKKKLVVDRNHRLLEVCFQAGGGALRTPGFLEAEQAEEEFARAERARLLYVALTRAGRQLVVPFPRAVRSADENSLRSQFTASPAWMSWLEHPPGPVEGAIGVVVAAEPEASLPVEKAASPAADAEPGEPELAAWKERRRALLLSADQIIVTTPSALHAGTEPLPSAPPSPRGAAVGSAVHQALEWLLAGGRGELETLARRAAFQERLEREEADRVVALVERAWKTETLRRARQAGRLLVEPPIVWEAPIEAWPKEVAAILRRQIDAAGRSAPPRGVPVVVEGIADLVFEGPEGLVLADYKTDPWETEADLDRLAGRYRPQLELYAAAIEGSTCRPVKERRLIFLGGPETVERPV